jgi:hypothetical protein
MPGTNVDWNVAAIANTRGQIWANLAIPAPGGRLSLFTDGTPDATANPKAVHLGMTREGAAYMVKPKFEQYYADEFIAPVKTNLGEMEAMIQAEILQVTDTKLLELLTPGVGTKTTGTGYEQVTFGQCAIVYSSVAVIFPTEADPTKFAVFHLYKAINEGGIEMKIGRKQLSGIQVSFRGYEITSRAASDTLGSFWKQTA